MYALSANPTAPGVGVKYMKKVNTDCMARMVTAGTSYWRPLIRTTEKEKRVIRKRQVLRLKYFFFESLIAKACYGMYWLIQQEKSE